MSVKPTFFQRVKAAIQARLVVDWKSRLTDYSTRIAKWGALLQGLMLMAPPGVVPKDCAAYLAMLMFVMVGIAKIVNEPGKEPG